MISVIIPTIGRSDTIYRAVTSALNVSTSLVTEIVILDNSQDIEFSSALDKKIENFSDPRLYVSAYKERKTMAESWNGGIQLVSNDWILYLHDDDELRPDFFNSISSCVFSDAYSFYAFGYNVIQQGRSFEVLYEKQANEDLISPIISNCPKFVSTIINRKSLIDIGGWNDKYGYFLDLVGFLEIAKKNPPKYIDVVIGKYFIHEDNLSSISRRAKGYGDYIPEVAAKVFSLYGSSKYRKQFISLCCSFVYPEKPSLLMRIVTKIDGLIVSK
jgi:glycosyltransferase involved in cell wall biosynthesis